MLSSCLHIPFSVTLNPQTRHYSNYTAIDIDVFLFALANLL